MRTVARNWRALASGLIALVLTSGRPAAQAPTITISPGSPTILVGQTKQFTASGTLLPAAISGGWGHTCMLMSDSSVRCAGLNNWGQLGNGGFASASTPVAASGLTNAAFVGAGMEHTCALVSDGTMRCWGTNYVGQLGNGWVGTFSEIPRPVPGITTAVGAAVGGFHNCAILSDQSVKCWGRNQDGQVGNGDNTADVGSPQTVIGLGPVAALTGGGYHTCALMPDATVRCWGRNTRGQLGAGSSAFFSSTPVPVSGLTNAVAVSGGFYHTCALLQDGSVQCWGENDSGQIGNTLAYSSVPITVSGISNAVAISAGTYHSCALLSDGTMRCWGRNSNGQLGDGTTTNSSSPVAVSGLAGASNVGAGGLHTCALVADRSGRCWGWNTYGQLGNGNATDSGTPVNVNGTGVTWTSGNTAIATIDSSGRATGVAAGSAVITATDASGGSASTTLTVTEQKTLSIAASGNGSGSVSSSPAGISCGTDCAETYLSGTVVTLTATPASGSLFAGWSGGGCTGTGPCAVTVSSDITIGARFDLITFPLTVTRTGTGGGTVGSSPAGISCGADCSEAYPIGTVVTLSAIPDNVSVFAGWTGGGCTGTGTCAVTVTADTGISARFDPMTFPLTVSRLGSGTGTVSSTPAGINCGTDCSESYVINTSVTLTAVAASGSVLTGWTGCSTSSGATCTVAMSAARSVTATFAKVFTLTVQKSGVGGGTVSSSPAGINCGTACSASYISGTTVTLTATPSVLSVFTGWTGCDTASGATCTVAMTAAKSVTAGFLGVP